MKLVLKGKRTVTDLDKARAALLTKLEMGASLTSADIDQLIGIARLQDEADLKARIQDDWHDKMVELALAEDAKKAAKAKKGPWDDLPKADLPVVKLVIPQSLNPLPVGKG
jgi:hypothetical protein